MRQTLEAGVFSEVGIRNVTSDAAMVSGRVGRCQQRMELADASPTEQVARSHRPWGDRGRYNAHALPLVRARLGLRRDAGPAAARAAAIEEVGPFGPVRLPGVGPLFDRRAPRRAVG
jgi:hypothetical protein